MAQPMTDTQHIAGTVGHGKRASEVGDIVTVIVNESTQGGRPKTTDSATTFDYPDGLDSEALTRLRFAKRASMDDRRHLRATITALVTEVTPNGFLKVEGQRQLRINDEIDTLTVQGILRSEDISSDNTVFSTQLANADITYTGDGLTPKSESATEEEEIVAPAKNAKKAGPVMRFLAGFIPFL